MVTKELIAVKDFLVFLRRYSLVDWGLVFDAITQVLEARHWRTNPMRFLRKKEQNQK